MAREGELFYREEKEVGRVIINKESMAFHWLSLCQERIGVFSSSCWGVLSSRGTGAPPSGLLTLFNWGFCLLIFYRIFLQHLLWEPGWVPGCKTHKSMGSSLWLGPLGVFNFRSCLHWTSSNLSITVCVFLTWHQLPWQFSLVSRL